MASKAPRRTAERIVDSALGLFNRFGEPNVATTMVAAESGRQSRQFGTTTTQAK
jgi:AcrR family transcriptional regulator